MGNFDFLKNIGTSKSDHEEVKDKDITNKVIELDNLVNRRLMGKTYKDELLQLFMSKKITEVVFEREKNKSIRLYEKIEIDVLGISSKFTNEKFDEWFYVGVLDSAYTESKERPKKNGKTTINFLKYLLQQLNGQILTIKDCNSLSDNLGFDLLKAFEYKQITPKE